MPTNLPHVLLSSPKLLIRTFGAIVPCLLPAIASTRPTSAGFEVNNRNRNAMLALWHGAYQTSEGYESRVKWNGNYSGKPGKTSDAFVGDVERRINFFRAVCGVPANVKVNSDSRVVIESNDPYRPAAQTSKAVAAQQSALLLILNYNPNTGQDPAINHDPAPGLRGWTTAAWNANARGNLAFGVFGPGAIDEYMIEELANGSTATSNWNSHVGHRRWILFPEATDFATGDQPGTSAHTPPTNVLYVTQHDRERKADPTPGFVAYPAAGFFPAPLNSRYWSLSRDGADFRQAKVALTDSKGRSVPVTVVSTNSGYGSPAIVWQVPAAVAAQRVAADRGYSVTITGIRGGGIPSSHHYQIILTDPERLNSRQILSGPSTAPANKPTGFRFPAVPETERVQVTAFRRKSQRWVEGAENRPKVIDDTSPVYPLRVRLSKYPAFRSLPGKYAFRLTFPSTYDLIARGVPDQCFEIDRTLIAKSGARFQFTYRRGYMSRGSKLAVERSTNGGVSWKRIGRVITGVSDTHWDDRITKASFALPRSSAPFRVRFRYFTDSRSSIFTHSNTPNDPTGIFIDSITTKRCDWLEPRKTSTYGRAAATHRFSSATAGLPLVKGQKWALGLRNRLGGHWFPYGPLKYLTVR